MLLAIAAIYGVANSSAFTVAEVDIEGATLTDAGAVEAALASTRGQNLFGLATEPLEAAIGELDTVASASVSMRLPATIHVRLEEREPILVWAVGDDRFLVDVDGRLFASLGVDAPAATAGLPVIDDRRDGSALLRVGSQLDPVDIDAARRLGSLVPADVGSELPTLTVVVNDQRGFVVRSEPDGWDAVFGFYTPSLRTPELIPGQVRLLRSLITGREPLVDRVILASETDGTYTEKPTPVPSASGTP